MALWLLQPEYGRAGRREKRINAFFRLQNPGVIAGLREKFPEIGEHPDARTVFVKLRELRNRW